MNILLLNWRDSKHPRAGGVELRLHRIYAALVARGHRVRLYACGFPGSEATDEAEGMEIRRVGNDWTYAGLCAANCRRWAKAFHADVVVEDLNKLPLYSPLTWSGPLLVQMHHLWGKTIFREALFPVAFPVWLAERTVPWIYRKAFFCVVSEGSKNELIRMGVHENRLRVVYNGQDRPTEDVPGSAAPHPTILWIGRLQKYKGILEACEAFQRIAEEFPLTELVVIGDGPYRKRVEAWLKRNPAASRIRMMGRLSNVDKMRHLRQASVLLQTSHKEGWGLTVMEAASVGVPSVANRTAGLVESVRDGKTGLLYDFNDLGDCVAKLRTLLADDGLRRTLGEEARIWSREFNWETAADQIETLLREISGS